MSKGVKKQSRPLIRQRSVFEQKTWLIYQCDRTDIGTDQNNSYIQTLKTNSIRQANHSIIESLFKLTAQTTNNLNSSLFFFSCTK